MKKTTIGIALLAALAIGVVWWQFGAKSAAAEAVYPAGRAKNAVVRYVSTRCRALFRRAEMASENERLKREVALLAAARGDAERAWAENVRLRGLIEYAPGKKSGWLVAPVLSRGGTAGTMRVVTVGRGSLDGIRVNAAAAVKEGLVGRVIAVSPHTSEILLITDPTSNVACEIKAGDGRRVFCIASGAGRAEKLRLRHLAVDFDVPPRAEVVTSGRGGVFPAGLKVGFAADVRPDASGLEKEGDAITAADFDGLEDVLLRHAE